MHLRTLAHERDCIYRHNSTHKHIKITPVSVLVYVRLVTAVLALSIFRIQFDRCCTVNTNWGILFSVIQVLNGVTTRLYLCKLSWQVQILQESSTCEAVVSKWLYKGIPDLDMTIYSESAVVPKSHTLHVVASCLHFVCVSNWMEIEESSYAVPWS